MVLTCPFLNGKKENNVQQLEVALVEIFNCDLGHKCSGNFRPFLNGFIRLFFRFFSF